MGFLYIELRIGSRTICMGRDAKGRLQEFGLTKVTGLESAEYELTTSDTAMSDGVTVDGKRVKQRAIVIEATARNVKNNSITRQNLIKFFNPKYTGEMYINRSGVERVIQFELENGVEFSAETTLDADLSFQVNLMCPKPYLLDTSDFGRSMAAQTPLFAFPFYSLASRMETGKLDYPAKARGLLLGGITTGYRTLTQNALLANNGDVPTGLKIKFMAVGGEVVNPQILKVNTGEYMRVVVTLQKGDELVVDTTPRNQVIELNGENIYQKIDRTSTPFQIEVGDNVLRYDADEGYTNLDVRLYYTPNYLGV